MYHIKTLLRKIYKNITNLTWPVISMVVCFHLVISYFGLLFLNEAIASNLTDFIYYWMVTASTVGYGDMSPGTPMGKLFVSFWVIPGALGIFGMLLGKIATSVSERISKRMNGMSNYSHLQNHIVIVGGMDNRTKKMVELILADENRDKQEIVLVTQKNVQNPMPDHAKFIKGDNITDDDVLDRAGVATSSRIIIIGENDDQTLAAGVAVYTKTREDMGRIEHIVAYFEREQMAEMFKRLCPTAECFSSFSSELLVRASQDPGSTRVPKSLFNTQNGDTQFSIKIPKIENTTYWNIFKFFKENYDATVLGVATTATGDDLEVNAPINTPIITGQILYYVCDKRLKTNDVAWSKLNSVTA